MALLKARQLTVIKIFMKIGLTHGWETADIRSAEEMSRVQREEIVGRMAEFMSTNGLQTELSYTASGNVNFGTTT